MSDRQCCECTGIVVFACHLRGDQMQLRDPMAAGDALLDGCCNNDCSANATAFSLSRERIPIAAAASLFVVGLAWAGPMGRMVELAGKDSL
ncbi:hypothetical protein [Prochlorococcus sp. P1361]|uniref:hypothetical protein n=1 Tax=unclassified Prochlorococcus TaxID=2627481 RepID=UPI00197E9067|nr:hypothetical protein [Prochlorococcus sp. P1361]